MVVIDSGRCELRPLASGPSGTPHRSLSWARSGLLLALPDCLLDLLPQSEDLGILSMKLWIEKLYLRLFFLVVAFPHVAT
jgi:hypothetical protein